MDRLRKAILAVLADDMDMIGEPVASPEELIAAFNAVVHNMPDFDKIEVST